MSYTGEDHYEGREHYGSERDSHEHIIDNGRESVNFSYQHEGYGDRANNNERPDPFGNGGHYAHYERTSSESGSDRYDGHEDDNYWREDYNDWGGSGGYDDYDENYEPEFIGNASGCHRSGEMLLFCAFVGEKNAPFYIEMDENNLVRDLKHAIKAKNAETVLSDASMLQLFVGKKLSGRWMNLEEANDVALDTDGCPIDLLAMDPLTQIKDAVIFGSGCESGECQIHVLVVLSPRDLKRLREGGNTVPYSKITCIQDLLKNCDVSGNLPQPGELVNLFEWDDSDCGKVKDMEAVGNIMEFARPKFYVRKEILCVLENFKKFLQEKGTSASLKQQFIFVGSPGTGKSCILALICFYLATVKKVPVVLHRCVNTGGDTLATTRFFYDGKYYEWIDVDGEVYKSVRLNGRTIFPDCWYCLDGLDQKQLRARNWSNLYTLLATSGQFEKMGEGGSKQVNCLVPYWRRDDLQRMAVQVPSPDGRDAAPRYFVSGGNVRDFFVPGITVSNAVNLALHSMDYDPLLSASGCNSQGIDRFRMMGVTDTASAQHYIHSCFWRPCVTSAMVLRHLVGKVNPSFFLRLVIMTKELNDCYLQGVALEYLFHSFVRCQHDASISYLKYDNVSRAQCKREDTGTIIFDSGEQLSIQFKREGNSIDEYVAVMKQWAAVPTEMDYWIPECSVCETIDAAAKGKLVSDSVETSKVGSTVERICFLQVTTDLKHKCDEEVLWELAKPFLDAQKQVCYLVLLCDSGFGMFTDSKKDKTWKFRLGPEEIQMDKIKDQIPVYVAHAPC